MKRSLRVCRWLLLMAAGGLVACAGALPIVAPPPDPEGVTYRVLTEPIIALGDTQEHETAGLPLLENDSAVDAYVEVAQRPPEQPLFGRHVLGWVLDQHPQMPVIHLGDLLDVSCKSEMARIGEVMAGARQPGAILPGNHDGLLFGIYNYNVLDTVLDPDAHKWEKGCRRAQAASLEAVDASAAPPSERSVLTKRDFIARYVNAVAQRRPHASGLHVDEAQDNFHMVWRSPDPKDFIQGMAVQLAPGARFAQSWLLQELRLPKAPAAPRGVIVLALDTNQVDALVGTLDTLQGRSPGSVGNVHYEQMALATQWAQAARKRGDWVILAGHHNWTQLSLASRLLMTQLWRTLDQPMIYWSAHTHQGFWSRHVVLNRQLLELNVSSLSDWPIAYREIQVQESEDGRRLKVVAALRPHPENQRVQSDQELMQAWETLACQASGVPLDRLRVEDLALSQAQKRHRGGLWDWVRAAIGTWCPQCNTDIYLHAMRYQDDLIDTLSTAMADLQLGESASSGLQLPAFCQGLGWTACVAQERQAGGLDRIEEAQKSFVRRSMLTQAGAQYVNHRTQLPQQQVRAYLACRAVQGAWADFRLTPSESHGANSEEGRRYLDYFRTEASIGLE